MFLIENFKAFPLQFGEKVNFFVRPEFRISQTTHVKTPSLREKFRIFEHNSFEKKKHKLEEIKTSF